MNASSPFFDVPPNNWITQNRSAFAIFDRYPVNPGHALVIPRRLMATWWEASDDERGDILRLVDEVREVIDQRYEPDGYNIGVNVGDAAGQTVSHLHVHVIPRHHGDMADPRGGVRHVIPERGNYLLPSDAEPGSPLLDGLQRSLKLDLLAAIQNPMFEHIDLAVSFIMRSGIGVVEQHLAEAIERGARLRVLTTDYLGVTDPDALVRLLDIQQSHGESVQLRVFETSSTSFHPKAYIFRSAHGQAGKGFVGSSNLSGSGLDGGIEWNVVVDDVGPLVEAFDRLWNEPRTRVLDADWLNRYRKARPASRIASPSEMATIGVEPEPVAQPVAPRPIQVGALAALEDTRHAGHAAGLVVMATGLGKTWVSAFDSARPEFRRVLFVAHREEILRQSLAAFRQVRPNAQLGMFTGDTKQPDADVVFASVQTLTKRLHKFDPDQFDYVVVDEFHHAAAKTYRRVIDYFDPSFLLGLTATPHRTDGADLLALCGDNIVFECDLVEGIRRNELSPFHYVGIADTVDFDPIPWRNGHFDTETLAAAVQTHERAERSFDEWRERGGQRTLAFCCTIDHADFMANYFRERGIACASVHSGSTSDPRVDSVQRLAAGDIDILFAIDIFNEGFDLPEIDTVLMLRPTESPIIFLQQLGRGLRLSDDKEHLQVIDFIGNHRSFLLKPRTLLSLAGSQLPTRRELLDSIERPEDLDLPHGCSVTWGLEAIDLLEKLIRESSRGSSKLLEYVVDYVIEHGERPTAVQAYRAGHDLGRAKGGWFGLLAEANVIDANERRLVDNSGDVLAQLEKEPLTKSYKLVTLRALLHDRTLLTGTTVEKLSATSRDLIRRDPRLVNDAAAGDPMGSTAEQWLKYWKQFPIKHWTVEGKKTGDPLFSLEGSSFRPTFRVADADEGLFEELVAEIVDYKMARYLDRPQSEFGSIPTDLIFRGRPIDAKVSIEPTHDERIAVTFEASGGSADSRINSDYVDAVDHILLRAADLGLAMDDAYIDTVRTRSLPLEERRLDPGGSGFPAKIAPGDSAAKLRRDLLRSMARAGRSSTSKGGGNSRKRWTVILDGAGSRPMPALIDQLRRGRPDDGPVEAEGQLPTA